MSGWRFPLGFFACKQITQRGESIKKPIPRRPPTMLLSPARGNQKADQVVNLVGFFSACVCKTELLHCVRAYICTSGGGTRESDESSGTACRQQQQARGRVKINSFIFICSLVVRAPFSSCNSSDLLWFLVFLPTCA